MIQCFFNNRKYATDAVFSLGYRVLSAGFSFGLYLLIPVLLGAEALGSFSLFNAWLVALGTIATMGLNILLLRLVSQYSIPFVSRLYSFSLVVVAIISLVLAYAAITIGDLSNGQWLEAIGLNQWIVLLLFALPFQSILMINVELIRGMHKVKVSEFFRNLFTHVLTAGIMGVLIVYQKSANAPVFGLLLGTVVSAVVSTAYVLRAFYAEKHEGETMPEKVGVRSALLMALPMMGSSVLQSWNSRIMVILLGSFTSKELTGVFSLAFKLSTLPDFVVSALKAPATPLISKLFWSKQWAALDDLLQSTVRMIAWTAIPATIILMAFAGPILGIAGTTFQVGVTTLLILSLAQACGSLVGLTGAFLNMSNHHTVLFMAVAVGLVLNVITGWWLIPELGIVGGAIAYFIGTLVWNGTSALFIKHRYNLRTFFSPFNRTKSLAL